MNYSAGMEMFVIFIGFHLYLFFLPLQRNIDRKTKFLNPSTFTGVVGKVQGREGGGKKRAHGGQGSNPGPTAC